MNKVEKSIFYMMFIANLLCGICNLAMAIKTKQAVYISVSCWTMATLAWQVNYYSLKRDNNLLLKIRKEWINRLSIEKQNLVEFIVDVGKDEYEVELDKDLVYELDRRLYGTGYTLIKTWKNKENGIIVVTDWALRKENVTEEVVLESSKNEFYELMLYIRKLEREKK